jgi:hypothetical protein
MVGSWACRVLNAGGGLARRSGVFDGLFSPVVRGPSAAQTALGLGCKAGAQVELLGVAPPNDLGLTLGFGLRPVDRWLLLCSRFLLRDFSAEAVLVRSRPPGLCAWRTCRGDPSFGA